MIQPISLDAFNAKDVNIWKATGLHADEAFNIHQVCIGNLDITCHVEIDASKKGSRCYDFNSGALELKLTEEGQAVLQTPLEDLEGALKELSLKELRCIKPHEISSKGFSRYVYKLFHSGYHDPSSDLVEQLLENYSRNMKDPTLDKVVDAITKEISSFCALKQIPLWMLNVSMLLTQDDEPVMQVMRQKIYDRLMHCLDPISHPFKAIIMQTLPSKDFSQLSWCLLLAADELHVKNHRGEPHVQLHLNHPYPGYFLVPVSLLKHHILKASPEIFSQILIQPIAHTLSKQTKEVLQSILEKQSHDREFFPIAFMLGQKFGLKPQPALGKKFCIWYESLALDNKEKIPHSVILAILPTLSCEMGLSLESKVSLLKAVKVCLDSSQISPLDPSMHPEFVITMIESLIRSGEFESLHAQDQHQLLDLLALHQKSFFSSEHALIRNIKQMLNLSIYLFKHAKIQQEDLLNLIDYCHCHKLEQEACKILSLITKKGPRLKADALIKQLRTLIKHNHKLFIEFLHEHSRELEQIDSFFEHLVGQCHLEILTSLDSSRFTEYLDYLSALRKDLITSDVLILSKDRALSGCANALASIQQVCKIQNSTLADAIDLATLDETSLKQLLTIPAFQHELKTHLATKTCVIQSALRVGMKELAQDQIKILLSFSPQHAFALLNALEKDVFDGFSLATTASWVFALSAYPELENTEFAQSSLVSMCLDQCAKRCALLASELPSPQELSYIASLHKSFCLHHPHHNAWQQVWTHLEAFSSHDLERWIDIETFFSKFQDAQMHLAMLPLFKRLSVRIAFITQYAHALDFLIKKEGFFPAQAQIDCLFALISTAQDEYWKVDLKLAQPNEHIYKLFEFFTLHFLTSQHDPLEKEERFELVFNALRGMQLFGSTQSIKDSIPRLLFSFIHQEGQQYQAMLAQTGKHQIVYLALIIKVLQERDLEEFKNLLPVYPQLCAFEASPCAALVGQSTASIEFVCKEFTKALYGCSFTPTSSSFVQEQALARCYHTYLSDILLSIELMASRASTTVQKSEALKKHKLIFFFLKEQFEFFGCEKHFYALDTFSKLIQHLGKLPEPLQIEIVSKIVKLVTTLVKSRKAIPQGKDAEILNTMLHHLHLVLDFRKHVKGLLATELKTFLEAFQDLLHLTMDQGVLSDAVIPMSRAFEHMLPQDVFDEYFSDRLRALHAKKSRVSLPELNAFALIIFRIDPNFQIAMNKDPTFGLQGKKPLDYRKYFADKAHIQAFLRLFQATFEKFGSEIPKELAYDSQKNLNIFALFSILCPYIREGIDRTKSEKDKHHLWDEYLNVIAPQLLVESNCITRKIIAMTWNCLFYTDRTLAIRFRFTEKPQMQRNAVVFYNLYKKIDQLTSQERKESGIDLDRMAELFKNSKDSLKKFLSLAQYSELMLRADSFASFATGDMFTNGAFPSLEVGAAAAVQPQQLEAFHLEDF